MIREYRDYSLLSHNTFGVDVCAKRFVEYDCAEDVSILAGRLGGCGVLHIGAGSNMLFVSAPEQVVLHSRVGGIELGDELPGGRVEVCVGGGVVWDDVVAWCVERGLYGLENLSGIPGETGAAAVQNIGAYGVEAGDVVLRVEAVDLRSGGLRVFSSEECGYGYRMSVFKGELCGCYAVTRVVLSLSRCFVPVTGYGGVVDALRCRGIDPDAVSAADMRRTILDVRVSKLPDVRTTGNAGSFFVNPVLSKDRAAELLRVYPDLPHFDAGVDGVKFPAARLIELCGWRGRSLGRARVYEGQALVLVNSGGASGGDILALCRAVQADVWKKFGVELVPEVNIIGGL